MHGRRALQEENDETRGSEMERGSASEIRKESKEHDKSEAVGAQGCDLTDPTSMPWPPSEPSQPYSAHPYPHP